jgi:histidinol-phosphate aminotransferase
MTVRPRPEILAIDAYAPGQAAVQGANRVFKLSANEGAFGLPPGARDAVLREADELFRYPDGGAVALRRAIGARFGLDPDRIVCGAGSDDLIYQLCLSYSGPGTEIVMSAHGFSMYEIVGRYAGATVRKAPERNLTADVDAIVACVGPATRIVFLANPNNPTGSMLPAAELERLRRGLPREVLLVIDSAYAEYVDRPDYDPGIALVDAGDHTVMTRTFSKIFGMGGLRLGWCYAPPAVVDVLNRVRSPFNVNAAAQAAGIAALAEPGWVEKSRAHNTQWRAWLTGALEKAGVKVWPSEGNFLLLDFAAPAQAEAADRFLRGRGIIARAMQAYALPHCLRITVGTEEECRLVAETLAGFMAGSRQKADA